jgi:hypothetical protein
MSWEGRVLLPVLALVCAVYFYDLRSRIPVRRVLSTRNTHTYHMCAKRSNPHSFTHVVVPYDTNEMFQGLTDRLRVDTWGWKAEVRSVLAIRRAEWQL